MEQVKIGDFGAGCEIHERELTSYVGSRFYRAPEISKIYLYRVLGMEYDYKVDLWALGCTLFEMYAGRILFPGDSNNQMLWLMMQLKGKFPKKMVRNASFSAKFFDAADDYSFLKQETRAGDEMYVKKVILNGPQIELADFISFEVSEKDKILHQLFLEFIQSSLTIDPRKRPCSSNCKSMALFSKSAST